MLTYRFNKLADGEHYAALEISWKKNVEYYLVRYNFNRRAVCYSGDSYRNLSIEYGLLPT